MTSSSCYSQRPLQGRMHLMWLGLLLAVAQAAYGYDDFPEDSHFSFSAPKPRSPPPSRRTHQLSSKRESTNSVSLTPENSVSHTLDNSDTVVDADRNALTAPPQVQMQPSCCCRASSRTDTAPGSGEGMATRMQSCCCCSGPASPKSTTEHATKPRKGFPCKILAACVTTTVAGLLAAGAFGGMVGYLNGKDAAKGPIQDELMAANVALTECKKERKELRQNEKYRLERLDAAQHPGLTDPSPAQGLEYDDYGTGYHDPNSQTTEEEDYEWGTADRIQSKIIEDSCCGRR